MWVECPTELDAPVFFVTSGFALALKRSKKGKAPGVLPHLMHRWDVAHVPGVLPVREVPWSPVAGDFDDD